MFALSIVKQNSKLICRSTSLNLYNFEEKLVNNIGKSIKENYGLKYANFIRPTVKERFANINFR